MGKGSRHSKNAGVMGSESLTYHERKAMGYGTLQERLGRESQGNFYDCALSLQTAVDPVVSKQGFIFSKEAILEYYLNQKKLKQRALKEWEKHQQKQQTKEAEAEDIKRQAAVLAFERQNVSVASDRTTDAIQTAAEREAANVGVEAVQASQFSITVNEARARDTKSFWQPQGTPSAETLVDKPDMDILCPVTGKKLRVKDLTPIHFTPAPDDSGGEFMDPVSRDILTNSSQLVALLPTGDVMLEKTYETVVKLEGAYEGRKITSKDVVKLMAGGTGFAGRDGQKLQASRTYTLGPGSGRADLRGQAAAGASRFGLTFHN